MIHLREQYWTVEVPSMAFGFDVNNYGDESEYMYMLAVEDITDEPNSDETLITKKLPPGTWQIVCTSKKATTEQAYEIIGDSHFPDSLTVFRTLLTSKGCDVKQNWLILKKQ